MKDKYLMISDYVYDYKYQIEQNPRCREKKSQFGSFSVTHKVSEYFWMNLLT